GLDHFFMTGQSAIGTGETKLEFTNHVSIWTTSINIEDQNHYPQLRYFAMHPNDHVKNRIADATRNSLYIISFEERNESTPTTSFKYVLINEHFKLYIPEYFGYKFTGWYYDHNGTEVKITDENGLSIAPFSFESNIVLYAKWTEAYHTVQFIDGNNKVIESLEIRHGQKVVEPIGLTATKNKDQLFVYQFLGWDFNFDQTYILEPTKIYAKFEQLDRYYEVIYYDGDEEVYEIVKGEYNTYLTPLQKVPEKTYHDDIAYKFIKWDYNYNLPVTGTIEIYPIFEEVERFYTVTFIKEGVVYHTEKVEYLRSAIGPDLIPTKDSTIDSVYEFVGWDKTFDVVTEDLVVTAIFEQKIREYTVIFKDGNLNTFSSQQVPYGNKAATPSGTPTKNPAFDKAFKFIGWDKDYSNITSDLVVNAVFMEVPRYYNVVFYDQNENVLSTQIVEYFQSAIAPNVELTKEPTVEYIYEFTGWDTNYQQVEENLE